MSSGRTALVPAAAVAGLALPVQAEGALRWRVWLDAEAQCARLAVPLDRSGAFDQRSPGAP